MIRDTGEQEQRERERKRGGGEGKGLDLEMCCEACRQQLVSIFTLAIS